MGARNAHNSQIWKPTPFHIFAPANENEKQQLQQFSNVCKGIRQVTQSADDQHIPTESHAHIISIVMVCDDLRRIHFITSSRLNCIELHMIISFK